MDLSRLDPYLAIIDFLVTIDYIMESIATVSLTAHGPRRPMTNIGVYENLSKRRQLFEI